MRMREPGEPGGANEYSARGDTSRCALIDEPSTEADAEVDEAAANEAGERSCAADLEAASLAGDARTGVWAWVAADEEDEAGAGAVVV
jgi:hypothetical protein